MALAGQAPEFASCRARHTRALPLFVAGSALLHVGLAASLPHLRSTPAVPDVLEVRLEQREPPPVTPPAALPLGPAIPHDPPPKKQQPVHKKSEPREVARPSIPAPAPPPVLALPQPSPQAPTVAEPSFTVPPREEKAPPSASEVATVRPAPAPEAAPAPAKVTPPRSDAAYLQNPQPRYPMSARRRGEQGTVVLKVLVTAEGQAGSVSVQSSSGSPALDQAALEAVKNWKFVPARQGTQPVEGWHLVPIVFKLESIS